MAPQSCRRDLGDYGRANDRDPDEHAGTAIAAGSPLAAYPVASPQSNFQYDPEPERDADWKIAHPDLRSRCISGPARKKFILQPSESVVTSSRRRRVSAQEKEVAAVEHGQHGA